MDEPQGTTTVPAEVPQAPPAKAQEAKPASLAEAYAIGDTGFSQDADAPVEPPSPTPTKKEPPAAAAQTQSGHPAYLVELAKDLGLAEDTIQLLPSDRLGEVVADLNRRSRTTANAVPAPGGTPGSQEATPGSSQGSARDGAPEYTIEGLDEKAYDSELITPIKNKFRMLEERLRYFEQKELYAEFDAGFAALGDAWSGVVGSGPVGSLTPNGREVKTRLNILKAAQAIPGKAPIAQKIKQAAEELYGAFVQGGSSPATPARPRNQNGQFVSPAVQERQQQWQGAALARPTQREGAPEPAGESKALKSAAKWMKEKGVGDSEDMEAEGFL